MSIGILNSALSGLAAFQRSLETTSNNISNVNTEGYNRQRAELSTFPEQYTGSGFIGSGVRVTNIVRSYDQFITGQVRSSTSAFAEVDSFHKLASQIDNLTADESTGLAPAMKEFFNAVNGVANDPTSIPAREVMLNQAESLSHQFNAMSDRFDDMRQQVNTNLDTAIDELNNYSKEIANLNVKIIEGIGISSGKRLPNDLMDQRDVLLNKIAEKVDISVVPQPDGSVSVFMGQGQSLIIGNYSATLSVADSATEADHKEILLNNQDISNLLSGGEIYGNLRFRDDVLNPAEQKLGLLATGMATEFNNIHKLGYDLNGTTGVAFFNFDTPEVQVISNAQDNTLTAAVTYVTPLSAAELGSSYLLTVDSTLPNTYTLTNLRDKTSRTLADDAALAALDTTVGFSISFGGVGSLTAGDTFEIDFDFDNAGTFEVNPAIAIPENIAAASALNLAGDNRIALQLAALESKTTMQGGKQSFTQIYDQLVTNVGTQTHTASISRTAQDVLLKQATGAREGLAGVNLDEEAANLIKFQNSYQAAARAVTVANSLFETLIGAVR